MKFSGVQVYQRRHLISFLHIIYFDLNLHRYGMKEEKVKQLFSPNISTHEQINR